MTCPPCNAEQLVALLLDQPWHRHAEIVPSYMPPHPRPETQPILAIRFADGSSHPPFLRHSCGPRQGFFWDVYGDDFQTPKLAVVALSQAPAPVSVAPLVFTIPLRRSATRTDSSQTASETLVGEGRDGDESPCEIKASPPVAPPSGTPRASEGSR